MKIIDSINFSIPGVTKNKIYNFHNTFRRCRKDFVYTCNYKGIHFNYFLLHSCLTLTTHTHKVLGRNNVKEDDIIEYLNSLETIIKEIVNIDEINLKLTRCDYNIDLKVSSQEELKEIFVLLNKHHKKFKYIEAKQDYSNSIYLCKPNSSIGINIYDKFSQILNEYNYEDENYRNVVRIELQLKKWKIYRLYKKQDIARNIKKYWCRQTMEEQYFDYLKDYLYVGDYYKLSKAKEIIFSSSYSNTIKKALIKFVTEINHNGITPTSKNYSYNTTKKYIRLLNELKINPITINDDCNIDMIENILNRARKVAEVTKFKKIKENKK